MRRRLLVALICLASTSATAQFHVASPYLLDPDRAIGYVDSCAAFWTKAYDPARGGFYSNIDRFGNLIAGWGTNKNLQTQSRDAYGFVRAYMLTGNDAYLSKARQALGFMYAHAWDASHGGWYGTMDQNGTPAATAAKSAFDQHYALLGIAAACEAMNDTLDWSWLRKGYASNEQHLWDTRPAYAGYFDEGSYDWSVLSGKGFNATVDAITTHLLPLYLMTGDDSYRKRLLAVADNMQQRLVASMDAQAIGFVEEYDGNWLPDNTETMTIMGHVLKTAWCFARLHQVLPDTAFVIAARKLADHVLARGYDHELGGPYKDYNRITGQMLMWGIADTAKAWWQMEQAVTAGLQLFDVTGDSTYLRMADGTLSFFMQYFVDHQYGDVYSDRTRKGGQAWGLEKGNTNKGGYHSIELGYYVYLYGNLFLHGRPVTLHYNFATDSTDRRVRLSPVAMRSNRLRIREVEHGGEAFADFDAATRELHLPPGKGGAFVVVFEPVGLSTVVASAPGPLPAQLSLHQNYPNPFNPSTTIRYELAGAEEVDLRVYDLLGREVAVLVHRLMPAGVHEARFDAAGLSSGVYLCRLSTGGAVLTRSMLLIR